MDFRFLNIASARLRLTSFAPEDAAESFAAQSAKLTRFMGWDPAPSLEAFAPVWGEWLAAAEAGKDAMLTIRLQAGREYVGQIGLHDVTAEAPEIGIWIRETLQGRGYGREAVAAVIGFGAGVCARAAFTYPVAEQNAPSRCLAESLGGVLVGRRNLRKSGGAEMPEVVYRIAGPGPTYA